MRTIDDLTADEDASPRQWALTPAADKDRFSRPFVPSKTYADVARDRFNDRFSLERRPSPPGPALLPASQTTSGGGWLETIGRWLRGDSR